FKRFKSDDFNLSDKEYPGGPRKYGNNDLEQLLAENSARKQIELAEQLGVTQQIISKRLHEMGKIQKEGKWVPHELTEADKNQRMAVYFSLLN
ncbi:Histone-lysine N-methyltransferase SETMAR, partial [Harpegnathos saltator]